MEYSKDLADRIDNKTELDPRSDEEIEIRACTIWAVELIRRKLGEKGLNVSVMNINDHLWIFSQTKHSDDKPYHLVRTTAY